MKLLVKLRGYAYSARGNISALSADMNTLYEIAAKSQFRTVSLVITMDERRQSWYQNNFQST